MVAKIKTYRAAWVLTGVSDPINDGVVVVQTGLQNGSNFPHDRVVAVEPFRSSAGYENLIDVGEGAIIPGLVNAHTHLEFSFLTQPLGKPGIPFTDWIRKIVAARNNVQSQDSASEDGNIDLKRKAIQLGLSDAGRRTANAGEAAVFSPDRRNGTSRVDRRNDRQDYEEVQEVIGRGDLADHHERFFRRRTATIEQHGHARDQPEPEELAEHRAEMA